MSGKKNKQDLNVSGLSPLVLNLLSPQSNKNSPAKNQAVIEAINYSADKLIAGYNRWKLCERKGLNSLEVIHDLRENSRTSSAPPSFTVLETYCQQLREVEAMLLSVINEVSQIQSQIQSSISIQRTLSTSSDDPLIQQLTTIDNFLTHLKQLYEADMSIKKTVIENIAHSSSDEESHVLVASWYCYPGSNEISKLVMQLKTSSADCRWEIKC